MQSIGSDSDSSMNTEDFHNPHGSQMFKETFKNKNTKMVLFKHSSLDSEESKTDSSDFDVYNPPV